MNFIPFILYNFSKGKLLENSSATIEKFASLFLGGKISIYYCCSCKINRTRNNNDPFNKKTSRFQYNDTIILIICLIDMFAIFFFFSNKFVYCNFNILVLYVQQFQLYSRYYSYVSKMCKDHFIIQELVYKTFPVFCSVTCQIMVQ